MRDNLEVGAQRARKGRGTANALKKIESIRLLAKELPRDFTHSGGCAGVGLYTDIVFPQEYERVVLFSLVTPFE